MGLSIGEILVILIVAFLIVGPDKMPEIGRALGKTVHDLKKSRNDSTAGFREEVEEIKKETGYSEVSSQVKEKEQAFKKDLDDLKKDLSLSDKGKK